MTSDTFDQKYNRRNCIVIEKFVDIDGKIHRTIIPKDKGCKKSPRCLTCHLPECLEIKREQTTKYRYKTNLGETKCF